MNIVLVRKGELYPVKYVWMLRDMLREHAPGHSLWTLTDQPDGLPTHKLRLRHDLPGWWSKLELFAPENKALRPFLFLDLDTYVLGGIRDILAWKPDRLAMLSDFYEPTQLASGVMVVPDYDDGVWRAFDRSHIGMAGGDQAFIGNIVPAALRLQEHFDGIVSYKVHGANSGRVLCYHGEPKPHTATEEHSWVRDVWSRYG